MNKILQTTIDVVKNVDANIKFLLIEIGARQVSRNKEPFYELLDHFPFSKIIGFEIDEETCNKMNFSAPKGVEYYPYALGEFNENRQLFIANHPMCTSLYKPNEKFISLYQNFEVAFLKSESTIDTITLDDFIEDNNIGSVDFIKIDVQGAELDIFKGGKKTLDNVLKIICEVEFVHHYENQPLFGDICNFLATHELMFNKFLKLEGRSLKPMILNNNLNYASQHIWSDAVFIRHIQKIPLLNDEKLLKLSLLAAVYGSADLTVYCLSKFDERNGSLLAKEWMQIAKRNLSI
jgi:FkbM family methyltransferase